MDTDDQPFSSEVPALPAWIEPEYPFDRRCFTVPTGAFAGRRIHFIDHGPRDARPVLLMHGNPMWSYLWRKVIPLLPDLRIVAPDLLGLGLSDKLPRLADHQLEPHGAAITALVDALDLEGLVLVGQDWGGPMVTQVGLNAPRRVAGLVLANTAVVVPERPRNTRFHRFANRPLISDLAFRLLGFPMQTLHRVQGDPGTLRGDGVKPYKWPLRRISDRIAPLALARMVPTHEGHPTMAPMRRAESWARDFEGPVSLVWGERDPILGRALKRHIPAFPDAPVRRSQAGHFLQEEVPELLAEAILETV
ncbi:MAG: alpha/beta fold hydrolase, partial [Acidobacteriota bacterium]